MMAHTREVMAMKSYQKLSVHLKIGGLNNLTSDCGVNSNY